MLYIAQDSIDNALAREGRLQDAIKGLATFAAYAVDEDATYRLRYALHRLIFEGHHLVHYTIDEAAGVLRVVNFRHGARQPQEGEP